MFLFFGTRNGKTLQKRLKGVRCPNCGQQDTIIATTTGNYVHLFWVPLAKVGSQAFAECTYCKRGFYRNDFTQQMEEALERQ